MDEKFDYKKETIRRFLEILKEVKETKKTIKMHTYFFNEVKKIMNNQTYCEIINERIKKIGISEIVINQFYTNVEVFNIKYNILTKTIIITPNISNSQLSTYKKEENNMLKILENYQIKKEKEIENKYNKQLKDLTDDDPVTFLLKQTEEAIKEMLNSENVRLIINSDVFEFTKETVDKKNAIINTIKEEKQKLRTKISEIESLLELAPNYEEKLQILRDYDIMDKKKNIIL